ncbi:hypothetical protein [Niveibacterium terrae]|uniref:hypothetical protein n=1 Tax=Niveibacterium terrae TaxID=3373598 RepID=UPI003A8C8D28
MKRSRFRMIRALSLAALLAASGTAAALWSQARRDQAQSALDQASASRQKIDARLQAVQDEKTALLRAQSRIAELGRRAALGAGTRPEWAQQLARIQRKLNLAEFAGEFAPPSRQSAPALCATPLKIKTRLRHEGEFLRLIAALQTGAIVLPRRCTLQRQTGQTPNITAECDLDWLTLDLAPAPPQKGSGSR